MPPDMKAAIQEKTPELLKSLFALAKQQRDLRVQAVAIKELLDRGWGRAAQTVNAKIEGVDVSLAHLDALKVLVSERSKPAVGLAVATGIVDEDESPALDRLARLEPPLVRSGPDSVRALRSLNVGTRSTAGACVYVGEGLGERIASGSGAGLEAPRHPAKGGRAGTRTATASSKFTSPTNRPVIDPAKKIGRVRKAAQTLCFRAGSLPHPSLFRIAWPTKN
jgi:hypothetical protein